MRLDRILVALLLLLTVGLVWQAGAQGLVGLSIDDLRFDAFPTIRVPVTVRNENGVPISGLGVDNFEIIEDGRASFAPAEATAQTNSSAAISVIMAIDISGSMEGEPIKEAMRAANALIDQLSDQDRGAIVAFADKVDLDVEKLAEGKEIDFTTDKNALRNVVNFLDTKIGWDTPLYDGIYKSIRMVSTEARGKRAVIVMTDGRDERDNAKGVAVKDAGSLSTPDDPINEANRHNIPIFAIGLEGVGGKIDTKYLERLAERTGGTFQKAPSPEELTPLFENVVNQLKQQYVLTYQSKLPEDDQEHSIMVRVDLPQGQAFNETKFRFRPEAVAQSTATVLAVPSPAPLTPSVKTASPTATPTPEPTEETLIDKVKDTIEDKPALAIVIGAGALLLLGLVIALIVVLIQGRRHRAQEAPVEGFDDLYGPLPSQVEEPTGPGRQPFDLPRDERTEAAPPGWGQPAAGAPPVGPLPMGMAPDAPIPQAGETKVIERAPKHLAMLVERLRPDRRYDLRGIVNFGRAADNEIVLDHATVSRHHAWIKCEGEEFFVFDVGSANGTFVNDERVEEPRLLASGDVIRFGEVELVFSRIF